MAGPPPLDLNALEAALVPPAEGLSAWARILCALDPRVGLRAAITAARLVQPHWEERFAENERFALTLAAAQAALDCPCGDCAEKAREAAIRSSKQLSGKSSAAHDAHRVALHAAEAAAFVTGPSVEAPSHLTLAFVRAVKLTSQAELIQAVQGEVLAWVMSAQGPIASHVAARLQISNEAPADDLVLAARLGCEEASDELGSRSGRFARFACPLDGWAVVLGDKAAQRAALIAAELVAPIYVEAFPEGRRLNELLVATRLILNDVPAAEGPEVTLARAERRLRRKVSPGHDALRVAISALKAALPECAPTSRYAADALCRAATLVPHELVVSAVQNGLLKWLGHDGPRVVLSIKQPRSWTRGAVQCATDHCVRPAIGDDPGCAEHRRRRPVRACSAPARAPAPPEPEAESLPPLTPWLEANRAALSSPEPPEPPPIRADWKIGHRVRVKPSMEKTNLGQGVVVDLEFVRGTDAVKAALVRFEHGPADGVWYSVNTLLPLEDLLGSKLH